MYNLGSQARVIGVVYMRFGKCMGTLGGRLCEVWEVYGGPRWS